MLLTHEWLARAGGSENVFEQMVRACPTADRQCLWNDDPDRFPDVHETWLARTPLRRRKAAALPLLRSALRSVPVEDYETVVANSHAFGHYSAYRAVQAGAAGFAYVHSPARYIWAVEHDDRGRGAAARTLAPAMRRLDRRTVTDRVHYAANSNFVRERIRSAWDVEADVIYPPVGVRRIVDALARPLDPSDEAVADSLPPVFLLGASRLVPYKRLDLVVDLGAALGLPVVVAGDGPDREELHARATRAGVDALFVGRVGDRLLYELYRRAALFVFLPVEDFGIMPLEAIAGGAPALVNASGGAWEGVGRTSAGLSADPADWPALVETARQALGLKAHAGADAVLQFDDAAFRDAFLRWVGRG